MDAGKSTLIVPRVRQLDCSAILIKRKLPNFGGKVVKAKQDAPLRRPGTTLSTFFVEKREHRRRNLFSSTKAPKRLSDLNAGK
jgi:hypothetical protein